MSYNVQFPGLGINVNVKTDAFSIGDYSIKWYGIIIAVGFLLAFIYALKSSKAMNINQDKLLDVIIVGIIVGVIGARLYYVLYYPGDKYIDNPISILYIFEGGLGIYGGIIGGLVGGAIMAKIRKISIPAVLDIGVLGFLIGQTIGRWGNFVNQEAFGAKCTNIFRMYSSETQSVVGGAAHPCFLYESVWCLIGFILLHIFTRKKRRYDGQTFLLYLIWYGVGRFFIESIRTDSLIVFKTIKVSQLVALVTVAVAIILLFVFRKCTKLSGCGNKDIMVLNNIVDEVPEEDIEEKSEPKFGTIFGELDYNDEEDSLADSSEKDAEEDNINTSEEAESEGIDEHSDSDSLNELDNTEEKVNDTADDQNNENDNK